MTVESLTTVETRLRWNVRALCLLRKTTRPIGLFPGPVLNAGEAKAAEVAFEAGWSAKDFVRILWNRDKLDRASKAGQ